MQLSRSLIFFCMRMAVFMPSCNTGPGEFSLPEARWSHICQVITLTWHLMLIILIMGLQMNWVDALQSRLDCWVTVNKLHLARWSCLCLLSVKKWINLCVLFYLKGESELRNPTYRELFPQSHTNFPDDKATGSAPHDLEHTHTNPLNRKVMITRWRLSLLKAFAFSLSCHH